jgi:Domain of unknown function (DUF4386)
MASLAQLRCPAFLWIGVYGLHYIPKVLAAFGVIASGFCVACTLIFIIFPAFEKIVNLWWFDRPMGIFDIVTSFWLLTKGLQPARSAAAV